MNYLFFKGFLFVLLCPLVSANEADKALAQSFNSSLFNGINTSSVAVVPHYEGTDVDASDLKDKPDLQNYALANTSDIEVANDIKFGHQNRPKVVIDPENDPLFTRVFPEAEVMSRIEDGTGAGTGETSTCVEVTPTEITNTFIDEKTCSTTGIDEYSSYRCTTTWAAYCANNSELGVQTATSTLNLAYAGHNTGIGTYRGTHTPFTMQVQVNASFKNSTLTQNQISGISGARWTGNIGGDLRLSTICNDPNYEVVNVSLTNNARWANANSALGYSGNYSRNFSSGVLSQPTCANGLTALLQMRGTGDSRRWKSWWL